MANVNVAGRDLTTGFERPLAPGDVATDSAGTAITSTVAAAAAAAQSTANAAAANASTAIGYFFGGTVNSGSTNFTGGGTLFGNNANFRGVSGYWHMQGGFIWDSGAQWQGSVALNGVTFSGALTLTSGDLSVNGGNIHCSGTLSKGSGSFKIDHPLAPGEKFLYHSFIESPDMKNVYDGTAELDVRGEALIELPDYFETLNRDFRYQLTCIGGYAPVYIAAKIKNNRFVIAGGEPGLEVSWQVTGIRRDAFAEKNRVPIEVDKTPEEQGRYLHPEAFGLPASKRITHRVPATVVEPVGASS